MVAPIDLKTGRNDAFEDDRANATSLMGRGATLFDQGQRRRQNLSLTTAEEFRHIRKNPVRFGCGRYTLHEWLEQK